MRHTCIILWRLLIWGLVCVSCKSNGRAQNIVIKAQSSNAENYPEPPRVDQNDLTESYLPEIKKHLVSDEQIEAMLRDARKDSVLHNAPSFDEMTVDAALNYFGRPYQMLKYGDTLILDYYDNYGAGGISYYFVRDTLMWIIAE